MTLGLDMSDGTARAVIVDDREHVVGRGEDASAPPPRARGVGAAVRQARRRPQERCSRRGDRRAAHRRLRCRRRSGRPAANCCPRRAPPLARRHRGRSGRRRAVVRRGAGAVQRRRVVRGEHVTSGDHPRRHADGRARTAGRRRWGGCRSIRSSVRTTGGSAGLEAEVSSAGIVRRFIWRIKSGDESAVAQQPWRRSVADHRRATCSRAARAGDGVCVSVIQDTAKYIGIAPSNLVVDSRSGGDRARRA